MFHGFRMFLLIIPPYSLIALGIITFICILSLFLSLRINKMRMIQLQHKDQSIFATPVVLVLISEVAMVVTTIFMLIFTNVVLGPLSGVHSEWGLVTYRDHINLVSYYIIYGLIYANLQFLSVFVFRKPLGNRFALLFVCYLTFNTGIWVTGNLILVLLGIPYYADTTLLKL